MAVPRGQRFEVPFDEVFPQGLYLVGEIAPVTEYQSQEDKARNRPVRPRTDEVTGLPLFRGTFADPSAEKDRHGGVRITGAAGASGGNTGCAVPAGRAGGADCSATSGSVRSG
jgi:hypothetical protein